MKNNFELKPQPFEKEKINKEREFFRVLDKFVCDIPYPVSDLEFEFDMPWVELKKLLDKNCQYSLIDGVFIMQSKEIDPGTAWRGKEFWADNFYHTLDSLECGEPYKTEVLSGKFGMPWKELEKFLAENCEYTLADGIFMILSRKENVRSQVNPPKWFYELRKIFFDAEGKYHCADWGKIPIPMKGYAYNVDAIHVGDSLVHYPYSTTNLEKGLRRLFEGEIKKQKS